MFDGREPVWFKEVNSGLGSLGEAAPAADQEDTPILVHLIGARELNNELLAFFLQTHGSLRCRLHTRLRSLAALEGELPAVVLLDMRGKDLGGLRRELAAIEAFEPAYLSRSRLALFNLEKDEELESMALRLGVRGFFYHFDAPEIFIKGVKAIQRGELWVSRKLLSSMVESNLSCETGEAAALEGLSQREQQILWLVQQGRRNQDIAAKLLISPHTVKTHLYNIFRKIEVTNRMQAANWARQNLSERLCGESQPARGRVGSLAST